MKIEGPQVQVMVRGRRIKMLSGDAADEVRRAREAGDEEAVQRIVARRVGRFD